MALITAIFAIALGFEPVDANTYWVAAFFAASLTGIAAIMLRTAFITICTLIKGA